MMKNDFRRKGVALLAALFFLFAAWPAFSGGKKEAPAGPAAQSGSAGQKQGGTFRYAAIAESPHLDQQVLTSDPSTIIAQHIFETLFAFDAGYNPVPFLASSYQEKNDGKLIVLELRQGVKFHNGKEMTSEDVVASLVRWGKFGVRGPILYAHIEKVEAAGKYTVNLYFKDVFAPWKALLALLNGGPAIYPKESVEGADQKPIAENKYIGTGPYRFVEKNPGRYVLLERFKDYSARTDTVGGYAGNRVAYFDKLQFIPVPDVGTRVNGVKAGDYDYAEQISGDLYDQLNSDGSVKTIVNEGAIFGLLFFNSKEGVFKGNYKLRQAVLAATDMNPVLLAAIGPKNLWKANGSIAVAGTPWYTEVAAQNYSQGNKAKAQALAQEAGYKGEKITLMTSQAYKHHYDSCVVLAKQWKDAGFNVDLQVYDWATLVSKRGDPKQWDIFFTHHSFVPDPVLFTFMSPAYPGWWTTEKREALANQFTKVLDQKQRLEIWNKIQTLVYEEVPIMKTGDIFSYDIMAPKVEGFGKTQLPWPRIWGISFK